MIQTDLFIDGADVASRQQFQVRDPGRLSDVVARVSSAGAAEVDAAVTAAWRAFGPWRATPLAERLEPVRAAADSLEQMSTELADVLVLEQGMLRRETLRDVGNAASSLRAAAAAAETVLRTEEHADGECRVRIEKVPLGVVAAIVPWNAPMVLTMNKVGPALVAGNTIVVKPSPHAPVAVTRALKAVAAHFPRGVINAVHGDGDVGPALTAHPLVRKVAFTGGTVTGRAVMAAAAQSIKRVDLELGGNDPAIVLDDASIGDIVPELIAGIFPRSGQVCFAIKRLYVPRALHREFCDTLCTGIDAFRVGHPLDPRTTLAPLNNRPQYDRVRGLIERARSSGAEVRELGSKVDAQGWDNGYYVLPVVVENADPRAEIVCTEQFGPVIPVVAYETEAQAVAMANAGDYGLCSSIWGRDTERADALALRMETGSTYVNSHSRTPFSARHMPFGGMKQSGIGRSGATVGLSQYVEYHAISSKPATAR